MKYIRKILIGLIVCGIISSASIFATVDPSLLSDNSSVARTNAFMSTSSHRMGMGSAGLGIGGFYDSYLYNPANLQKDGFKIVFPSLTLTVNNIYNLVEPTVGDNIINILENIKTDDSAPIALGELFIKSLPYGYGEVLTVDTNLGFKTRSFGLDLAVQEKLRSYNGGGDWTTTSMISETNVAATAALGFNIPFIEDVLSLDVGASGALKYKMYSSVLDVDTVLGLIPQEGSSVDIESVLLESIPFAAGYSIPVTVGANLNLPLGLSISAVGRNFNGNYNMVGYDSLKSLVNNDELIVSMIGSDQLGTPSTAPTEEDEFSVEIPWSLDVGLTFAPSTFLDDIIQAQIAFDMIDCYSLIEAAINETSTPLELQSDALTALNAGIQLKLLSLIDIRAGLSQGYKSIGVGFDILVLHLDASYYRKEYGDILGTSSSDALSLKFSLLSR